MKNNKTFYKANKLPIILFLGAIILLGYMVVQQSRHVGDDNRARFFRAIDSNDVAAVEESIRKLHVSQSLLNSGLQKATRSAGDDHLEVISSLIRSGADMNYANEKYFGFTALHNAIATDNIQLAELMVRLGANVNARDNRGRTPMFFLPIVRSESNQATILDLLIAGGANINDGDKNGQTPLIAAQASKREHLIELLIDKGAQRKANRAIVQSNSDASEDEQE